MRGIYRMLINSKPQKVTLALSENGGTQDIRLELTLDSIVRTVIGATQGQECNLIYLRNTIEGCPQIAVTRFPRSSWGDVWRLEFQVAHQPGRIRDITEFLESLNIDILTMETHAVFERPMHYHKYVCDFSRYRNSIDGDTNFRSSDERSFPYLLYALFSSKFVDLLDFSEGHFPRIYIRRVWPYHRFDFLLKRQQQEVGLNRVDPQNQDHYFFEEGVMVESEGRILLSRNMSRRIISDLNLSIRSIELLDRAQILISNSTANAKSRIIYTTIDATGDSLIHFTVYFDKKERSLDQVMARIVVCGLVVIRSQLRIGLIGNKENKEMQSAKKSDMLQPVTLNVFANSIGKLPAGTVYESLVSSLGGDGCFVHHRSIDKEEVAA